MPAKLSRRSTIFARSLAKKLNVHYVQCMPNETTAVDLHAINDLVGEEIIDLLFQKAPRKVASRIGKAIDHYNKALLLIGVDDEMGAIRLIAAEEELVVAIFEWLKLKSEHFPEHRDFVRRFKNHQVKLAFYPTLSQFRFILADMAEGFVLEGLEETDSWSAAVVCSDDRVDVSIRDGTGAELIRVNPFSIVVSRDDLTHDEVADEMYRDFVREVEKQHGISVRQFVTVRSDFRNKLLYAEDGGLWQMDETLEELLAASFKVALRDLIWTLGALICNDPLRPKLGLVAQFILLYRRVLAEAVDARLAVTTEPSSS